jgi:proteasome lid subunit RPN8/RPN11
MLTPIYLKTEENMPWPGDKVFYLLSRDGLFLCRNHPFFASSARADRWPAELAGHRPHLKSGYPRLPQAMVERVVGFFDLVAERYDSEAAVLLAWNRERKEIELLVPEQTGSVATSRYGGRYAMDLFYELPPLPPHLMLIGDIHSHVYGPAYASGTDKADEAYRPGLHMVVGRLQNEPPEFYCAVTADGARFRVDDLALVMEGYQQRRADLPPEWLGRVGVEEWNGSSHPPTIVPDREAAALALPGQGGAPANHTPIPPHEKNYLVPEPGA